MGGDLHPRPVQEKRLTSCAANLWPADKFTAADGKEGVIRGGRGEGKESMGQGREGDGTMMQVLSEVLSKEDGN